MGNEFEAYLSFESGNPVRDAWVYDDGTPIEPRIYLEGYSVEMMEDDTIAVSGYAPLASGYTAGGAVGYKFLMFISAWDYEVLGGTVTVDWSNGTS